MSLPDTAIAAIITGGFSIATLVITQCFNQHMTSKQLKAQEKQFEATRALEERKHAAEIAQQVKDRTHEDKLKAAHKLLEWFIRVDRYYDPTEYQEIDFVQEFRAHNMESFIQLYFSSSAKRRCHVALRRANEFAKEKCAASHYYSEMINGDEDDDFFSNLDEFIKGTKEPTDERIISFVESKRKANELETKYREAFSKLTMTLRKEIGLF